MKHTPTPWKITLEGTSKLGLNQDDCFKFQIGTHEKTVAYTWEPIPEASEENRANALLIINAVNNFVPCFELVKLAFAIREAQNTYFKTRTKEALVASKSLEKEFDIKVKSFLTQIVK